MNAGKILLPAALLIQFNIKHIEYLGSINEYRSKNETSSKNVATKLIFSYTSHRRKK